MGIFQSSSRGNDEGETSRSTFFFYNLWRKVCSIFGHAKPLLPLQNPASSISTEPLLFQTPHISSPTTFYDKDWKCDSNLWSAERDGEDHVVVYVDQFSNSAVSVKENVSRNRIALINNSSSEEDDDVVEDWKCDSNLWSTERDGEDHVVVYVDQFSDSAGSVKENVSRNGIALMNSSSSSSSEDDDDVVEDWKCDSNLWLTQRDGEDHVVVYVDQFSDSAVSVKENVSRNGIALMNNSSSSSSSEDDDDVVVEIKRAISVVLEERWIKHYSSGHRILLVGEGNFSFSACLAVEFRSAPNIIATSLDSRAFLKKHYNKSIDNIEELRKRGSKVMHEINATTMANHQQLGHLRFDRIIFNFPYVGLNSIKNLPRQSQLALHQELVRQFLENAKEMIGENGEIHITHKTNGFHREWGLVSLGHGCGLRLKEATEFNLVDYPGYNTKCGFGGNGDFNCYPSKTYKFRL